MKIECFVAVRAMGKRPPRFWTGYQKPGRFPRSRLLDFLAPLFSLTVRTAFLICSKGTLVFSLGIETLNFTISLLEDITER